MLYRGVNKDMHVHTGGQLVPHGSESVMSTYLHADTMLGPNTVFDFSEANAASAHESGCYNTCFVSVTRSWEVARSFATQVCGFPCEGFVYYLDDSLFDALGIRVIEPTERRYPDDQEVMIVAADGGNIPSEVIVRVEPVRAV